MLVGLAELALLLLDVLLVLGPVHAAPHAGPDVAYFVYDEGVPLPHLFALLFVPMLAGGTQYFPVLLLFLGPIRHLLDNTLAPFYAS